MFLALLVFTIVISSPQFRSEQAQKPSEGETMKQEFVRVQEQRLLEAQQAQDEAGQEVEQELLEPETAREEKLVLEEEQRPVAREQAELFKALE